MTRRIAPGARGRRVDLGARVVPLPSAMQRGNIERARLYNSARWRRARRAFLAVHPLCTECEKQGRVSAARVVDHRDGHQHADWLARFWDQSRWDALCLSCHAAKSRDELHQWQQAGEAVPGGRAKQGSAAAEHRRGSSRESGPTRQPFSGAE